MAGTANPRFEHALTFAVTAHTSGNQERKGTDFPFVVRPIRVAEILDRYGCGEEVVQRRVNRLPREPHALLDQPLDVPIQSRTLALPRAAASHVDAEPATAKFVLHIHSGRSHRIRPIFATDSAGNVTHRHHCGVTSSRLPRAEVLDVTVSGPPLQTLRYVVERLQPAAGRQIDDDSRFTCGEDRDGSDQISSPSWVKGLTPRES